MFTLLFSLRDCLRSRAVLQTEILALRHQLLIFERSRRGHNLRLRWTDRALCVWLSRLGRLAIGAADSQAGDCHRVASPGISALWEMEKSASTGRLSEALAESKRALELDVLSPIMNVHLGWHYLYARQYDRALDQLTKTLELDPNYGLAHWYRGLAYQQKGMYTEASESWARRGICSSTNRLWKLTSDTCTQFREEKARRKASLRG